MMNIKKTAILILMLLLFSFAISCGDGNASADAGAPCDNCTDADGNGKCDKCGSDVEKNLGPHEHSFTEAWVTHTEPTLTKRGKETNVCSDCGETVSRPIDKLTVTALEITAPPATVSYMTGDTFSPYGMTVKATLSNGATQEITDYDIDKKEPLDSSITEITVSYGGFSAKTPITVEEAIRSSVSQAVSHTDGDILFIDGYCVGYDTSTASKRLVILKDFSSDSIIFLDSKDFSYDIGDRINAYVKLNKGADGACLEITEKNADKSSTVISTENRFYFDLRDTVKIQNSDELGAFFASDRTAYTYLEISGRFYVNQKGELFGIHFNSSATTLEGTAVDGRKPVILVAENVDSEIISRALPFDEEDAHRGVPVNGTVCAVYVGSDADNYYITVLNDSWIMLDVYETNHDYVRETAYAFYHQGAQIDYDQYNTRRNINVTPEMATAARRIFLDCSSYVNSVYYSAFGVNILPYKMTEKSANTKNYAAYGEENPDAVDVVGFWKTADYPDAASKAALLDSLKYELRVGDVVVYRKASNTGHALIYVGNDTFLHCANTGSYEHDGTDPSQAFDQIANGSIQTETVENLFERSTATRYLLGSNMTSFTILRPLERGLTPTEQAERRIGIPGLLIEKNADVGPFSAVYTGDTITYTITLQSKTTEKTDNIILKEFIPDGTSFVSASEGVTVNGNEISWTGSVPSYKIERITFTVRVESAEVGKLIESNEGTVNGLKLNELYNTLSAISKDKITSLVEKANEYIAEAKEFDDPILAAKNLYLEILGEQIFSYESADEALADIIDKEALHVNQNASAYGIVLEDLSGGYSIKGSNPLRNERIRSISRNYLAVGDIIIASYINSENEACSTLYIYLGDDDCLEINNTEGKCAAAIINYGDSYNFLVRLYSHDTYAILRPSMQFTSK